MSKHLFFFQTEQSDEVFIKFLTFHVAIEKGVLKVPKREILDRSDFPHFYTIKSLRVGDFGVKIKKILKNI